jgi:prepilin-type N-terminal cleavage/methylation domain-containing protein
MHMKTASHRESGFTLIEMVIVLVVLGILVTLVGMTYNGVRAKNRNGQREADITTLQGALESYYAQKSAYPTLADLNSPTWVTQNMSDLPAGTLRDPHWSKGVAACTVDSHSVVISKAASNCYSYQVIATNGSACNNVQQICAHYTLTAILEGGVKYVKSSLN